MLYITFVKLYLFSTSYLEEVKMELCKKDKTFLNLTWYFWH